LRARCEADRTFRRVRRELFQVIDFIEDNVDEMSVLLLEGLDLLDSAGQFLTACQNFAQFHEGSHDDDVHLHGQFAVQDRREHRYAEFGESVGPGSAAAPGTR